MAKDGKSVEATAKADHVQLQVIRNGETTSIKLTAPKLDPHVETVAGNDLRKYIRILMQSAKLISAESRDNSVGGDGPTTCQCGPCLKRRAVDADQQALQKYWVQLRHSVRQMYREVVTAPHTEGEEGRQQQEDEEASKLKLDIEKLRMASKCLCDRDPHQLFQRLESQARQAVMDIRVNLLQLLVSPEKAGIYANTDDERTQVRAGKFMNKQVRSFLKSMVHTFVDFLKAVRSMNQFLGDLESSHLAQFSISWELVNQHLFHSIVYQYPLVQSSLPTLLSQLEQQCPESVDAQQLMAQFRKFQATMEAVGETWERTNERMEKYNRQQSKLCRVRHRLMKEDVEFFKLQRKLLEDCVRNGSLPGGAVSTTTTTTTKTAVSNGSVESIKLAKTLLTPDGREKKVMETHEFPIPPCSKGGAAKGGNEVARMGSDDGSEEGKDGSSSCSCEECLINDAIAGGLIEGLKKNGFGLNSAGEAFSSMIGNLSTETLSYLNEFDTSDEEDTSSMEDEDEDFQDAFSTCDFDDDVADLQEALKTDDVKANGASMEISPYAYGDWTVHFATPMSKMLSNACANKRESRLDEAKVKTLHKSGEPKERSTSATVTLSEKSDSPRTDVDASLERSLREATATDPGANVQDILKKFMSTHHKHRGSVDGADPKKPTARSTANTDSNNTSCDCSYCDLFSGSASLHATITASHNPMIKQRLRSKLKNKKAAAVPPEATAEVKVKEKAPGAVMKSDDVENYRGAQSIENILQYIEGDQAKSSKASKKSKSRQKAKQQQQTPQSNKAERKSSARKKPMEENGGVTESVEDVFMPQENENMDEVDREVEAFKKIVMDIQPQKKREKVNIDLSNIRTMLKINQ